MKKWYAVYTQSRAEKKASKLLKEKGIEEYLPLNKTLRQWSDRKKWVSEPLFRSYVFVRVNNKESWAVINTPGIVCFVTIGKERVPIPDCQIEAIRVYLGETELKDISFQLKVGTKVEVIYGALKGLIGILVSIKNKKKLKVQIDGINQNIMLTLPSHLLSETRKTNKSYA